MEFKNKKRIAILIDDYFPDSTKVAAKMMHELACEFLSRGYLVTVFTPKQMKQNCQITFLDGIEICQFKLGPIKNCAFVKRAINETLLSFSAQKNARMFCKSRKFDLIINYSPSIFWGYFARYLMNLNNAKTYLILRDFFPQWIIDNGMIKKGSWIEKYFRFFERLNYKSSDRIGIQSPANITFFKSQYENKYPVSLLYNWASNVIPFGNYLFKEKYGLQDKIVFFYGGNIGKAQDMDNVLRLAKKLENHVDAHFLFVGEGDEVPLILSAINDSKAKNITYIKSIPQEDFKLLLKEIDVGLFTLNKHHKSHNFPGKILGYMINNVPILGSVNEGNDLEETIHQYGAGLVTTNGDDEQLYDNAMSLLLDEKLRISMGLNAQKLYYAKFTVAAAADEILSILEIEG